MFKRHAVYLPEHIGSEVSSSCALFHFSNCEQIFYTNTRKGLHTKAWLTGADNGQAFNSFDAKITARLLNGAGKMKWLVFFLASLQRT